MRNPSKLMYKNMPNNLHVVERIASMQMVIFLLKGDENKREKTAGRKIIALFKNKSSLENPNKTNTEKKGNKEAQKKGGKSRSISLLLERGDEGSVHEISPLWLCMQGEGHIKYCVKIIFIGHNTLTKQDYINLWIIIGHEGGQRNIKNIFRMNVFNDMMPRRHICLESIISQQLSYLEVELHAQHSPKSNSRATILLAILLRDYFPHFNEENQGWKRCQQELGGSICSKTKWDFVCTYFYYVRNKDDT
ncbi:hypothetical protein ACJX0J_011476 [Zea mays]